MTWISKEFTWFKTSTFLRLKKLSKFQAWSKQLMLKSGSRKLKSLRFMSFSGFALIFLNNWTKTSSIQESSTSLPRRILTAKKNISETKPSITPVSWLKSTSRSSSFLSKFRAKTSPSIYANSTKKFLVSKRTKSTSLLSTLQKKSSIFKRGCVRRSTKRELWTEFFSKSETESALGQNSTVCS